MNYELELKKQKNLYKIFFILGFLFFPIWLLNIGRGKIIKELEREVSRQRLQGTRKICINFDRALLRTLNSTLEAGIETYYHGARVKEVYYDKTKINPKTLEIYVVEE